MLNKHEREQLQKAQQATSDSYVKAILGELLETANKNRPEKCKKMCSGCRDNYYNGTGANECWCYAKAKVVVKKIYPYSHSLPADIIKIQTLSCYTRDYKSSVPYHLEVK